MDHTDAPYIKWLLGEHCVRSGDGKDCWLWTKSYRGNGYAQLTLEGRRQVQGNRAAWVAYYGPIPKGMYVCHKCDQPSCCNPLHLFLGTAKDNTQDCVEKGRLRPGRVGAKPKVQRHAYTEIASMRAAGLLQREIAAMFGISQVRVSQLLKAMNVDNTAR